MTINNNDNLDEEIIVEELDLEGDEKTLKQKLKDLKLQLKAKEQEAKDNLDGWQRARAEVVNKEKQIQVEKLEMYKNASADLLEQIIPVLDSYEMARKNKENWEKVDQNWRIGVEYIFQQLMTVTENAGLTKVDCKIGDKFDVNTMSAVEEVSTSDVAQDNKIADIIQSGYKLNQKLLRETKVKIYTLK